MEHDVILVENGKKEDIEKIIRDIKADKYNIKEQGDPSLAEKIEEASKIISLKEGFSPKFCIVLDYKKLDYQGMKGLLSTSQQIESSLNRVVISFAYDTNDKPIRVYPN